MKEELPARWNATAASTDDEAHGWTDGLLVMSDHSVHTITPTVSRRTGVTMLVCRQNVCGHAQALTAATSVAREWAGNQRYETRGRLK